MARVADIAQALEQWAALAPGLKVDWSNPDCARVSAAGFSFQLEVSVYEHQEEHPFLVNSPTWHGHYETAMEAARAVVSILSGSSRLVEEYRGECLAATWLETWEEGSYATSNLATMLNPLDQTDWELWKGERWKVRRTRLSHLLPPDQLAFPPDVLPLGTEKTFETFSNESQAKLQHSTMSDWLTQWFGSPDEGFRWTLGPRNALAIQLPKGWRAIREKPPVQEYVRFAPEKEEALIHVTCYWRDRKPDSQVPQDDRPFPHTVTHERTSPCEETNGYIMDRWDADFVGPEDEMKALVYFYTPPKRDRRFARIRQQLAGALTKSRYMTS